MILHLYRGKVCLRNSVAQLSSSFQRLLSSSLIDSSSGSTFRSTFCSTYPSTFIPVRLAFCFISSGTPIGCLLTTLSAQLRLATPFSAWDPTFQLAKQSWRDFFFILMSISFGGLGLMSLRNPFAELVSMVFGKTDLRSLFCLLVFFIVISVLGQYYLLLPFFFISYIKVLIIFVELTPFFPLVQLISPIQLRTLFAHTSQSNPSASTSVVSMITLTMITSNRTTPVHATYPDATLSRHMLCLLIIPHPSILPIGHPCLLEPQNMYFIALVFLLLPQCCLWRNLPVATNETL